jgi:hypothetical protein
LIKANNPKNEFPLRPYFTLKEAVKFLNMKFERVDIDENYLILLKYNEIKIWTYIHGSSYDDIKIELNHYIYDEHDEFPNDKLSELTEIINRYAGHEYFYASLSWLQLEDLMFKDVTHTSEDFTDFYHPLGQETHTFKQRALSELGLNILASNMYFTLIQTQGQNIERSELCIFPDSINALINGELTTNTDPNKQRKHTNDISIETNAAAQKSRKSVMTALRDMAGIGNITQPHKAAEILKKYADQKVLEIPSKSDTIIKYLFPDA